MTAWFENKRSTMSGVWDMTKSVYDPANWARQVAFDDSVVHDTGNETIDWDKTFTWNTATKSLNVTWTGWNWHIHLKHQSSDATATWASTAIFADNNWNLKYKNALLSYVTFLTNSNIADRVYTFPDTTGTVLLDNTVWPLINSSTAKTTPVDADMFWLMDSASSNVLKKLSWLNVKATLKTYFDSLSTTLINKTIDFWSNFITWTKSDFNVACTDGNFVYIWDVLWTPTSWTLTNCTWLPVAWITASTSTALWVGSIELWHATDTSITRVSAWVVAVEWIPVIIAGSTTVWQVPTITGANTYSWQTPSTWGGFWTAMPWTPTRTWNTTFTVTWDVTAYVAKWMVIKWTESSAIKCAFVSIPSTYSAPNTTITIVWDTMASIDASSLKYSMLWLDIEDFNIAWTIWATATDVARTYCAPYPMRVLWADLDVWTAWTTNNTTVDINKNWNTMFTTKPTLATTVWASPLPFTADSGTSLALNNKVTIDIDAIQTTSAIDLYVHLYLFPTRYLSLA